MRRSLVQGDDTARHPFLQQLPRHVRHGGGLDPLRLRYMRLQPREAQRPRPQVMRPTSAGSRITISDVKDFLLAYCACFVAFTVFMA